MINFVQIDKIVGTWSKGIYKQHGARNITCFRLGMGEKIG